MNNPTAPETMCQNCGALFSVGVDGISPTVEGQSYDLCDFCAQTVRRGPQRYAFVEPLVIRRLIEGLKQQ